MATHGKQAVVYVLRVGTTILHPSYVGSKMAGRIPATIIKPHDVKMRSVLCVIIIR